MKPVIRLNLHAASSAVLGAARSGSRRQSCGPRSHYLCLRSGLPGTARLIGQKRPLKPKEVWAIRVRLQLNGRKRDLALFNLAIDSKLRGCDLVRLQLDDVCAGRDHGAVTQKRQGDRSSSKSRNRLGPRSAPFYPAIRSHRWCLGRECGARWFGLRHTFDAPDEGGADLAQAARVHRAREIPERRCTPRRNSCAKIAQDQHCEFLI